MWVPSKFNEEMFDPGRVIVRVTVAVDMSMSVTVAVPAEGTKRWPLTSMGAPGFAPTVM